MNQAVTQSPDPLDQHLSRALSDYPASAISAYGLGLLVYRVFRARETLDFKSKKDASRERRYAFSAAANSLLLYGLLSAVGGVSPGSAYIVLGRKPSGAAEVACTIDPFGYVSHLSAMELNGLTNRVAKQLFVSSPDPKTWKRSAAELMHRDLGDQLDQYLALGYPPLTRTRMNRVHGVSVEVTHRSHLGAFRKVPDSELRVATIGRTFLDMLREPDLCGGIQHVLDVYRQHGERYLSLIADEVDQHGSPIDKVRAGYVLEEVCGFEHPSIDAWSRYAARGGSRKLVANREYAPEYSVKWMLSVNA